MPSEAKQIKILFRAFLGRILDFELLSSGGESQNLLVQFAALLGAFNFVLAILLVPRYGTSMQSHATLIVNAWHDEEFFISTSLAIAAFLMVLSWESLIPDRRDCIALGVLPVRSHTVLTAKLAAIGCAISGAVLLVNIFTSFCYPLILVPTGGHFFTPLRTFIAYWITMLAAGIFIACAVLTIEGILSQILPQSLFLRVSGLLQVALFFGVLAIYFLKPPLATPKALFAASPSRWLLWMPSYWFFGLFHKLNGSAPGSAFNWLAVRALWALLASLLGAAAAYGLGYARTMRRMIEQPDILPGERRRRAGSLVRWLQNKAFRNSLQRALVLFHARTLARSRQHRLLIAFYSGIGVAIALAYFDSLREGDVSLTLQLHAFITASFFLLFFAILAVRVSFSFPHTLRANWIFRTTVVHRPSEYLDAARTSLYLIAAVPIWIVCAVLFFCMWANRPAVGHIIVLLVIGAFIVERSLNGFRKLPFACSYLPGKANLKVTLALYGTIIFFGMNAVGGIETWSLDRLARYLALLFVLAVAALAAFRRRAEFVNAPHNSLQFDDVPPDAFFALDLAADRDLTNDDEYIAAQRAPTLRSRLKTVFITLALLAIAGFVYEQVGRWHDRPLAPQVGHSVDIGGRSLNLYCSGEGSPTVIFEGNWGSPGYSWLPIQREVARFTKACWYDRAGYGWSDEGPFPNHSDSIARDLHRLLTSAHIAPPYVLAAHSMGAFHARVFRGFYPNEVAGLILIDPMNEDMTIHIHNHIEALRPRVLLIRRVLGNLGFERLFFPDMGRPQGGFTVQEWQTLVILRRQLKSRVAEGKEPPLWISGELARKSGSFGDIRVQVLSAGIQDQEEDPKLDHDHDLKMALHEKLAALSSRGQQIIVKSGHNIPMEAPGTVVEAISEVLRDLRDMAQSPAR